MTLSGSAIGLLSWGLTAERLHKGVYDYLTYLARSLGEPETHGPVSCLENSTHRRATFT